MDLMNKYIVPVGIIVLLVMLLLFFFLRKKWKDQYRDGLKAAKTKRVTESKLYNTLKREYALLRSIMVICLSISFVAALFLIARTFKRDDISSQVKKRDIILCLDVSYSLYELNYEVVDCLKEVVKGLEGDRIGVNIFNTSTVTYVPLTDDYDYVNQKLDELAVYFELQKKYMEEYDDFEFDMDDEESYEAYMDLMYELDYYDGGTLYNSGLKGSSLIGEGLGTALYSFPQLGDSERTRVIIMCTDNELNEFKPQIMTLQEAATACKKSSVKVYGIFPREEIFYEPEWNDYGECLGEFQGAVESTGGLCYVRTENRSVSEIVNDIQKQEALAVKVVVSKQIVDLPMVPFLIMLICLALGCSAGMVLQR